MGGRIYLECASQMHIYKPGGVYLRQVHLDSNSANFENAIFFIEMTHASMYNSRSLYSSSDRLDLLLLIH